VGVIASMSVLNIDCQSVDGKTDDVPRAATDIPGLGAFSFNVEVWLMAWVSMPWMDCSP
jgi:hypothetical protein